jgi:hypothetical protein
MKKLSIVAGCACLALALGMLPALAAGDMPGADAAALWKYISQTSPYQKWGQFPDKKGMHASQSPHGANVQVFANQEALAAKQAPLPFGAIIVKDGMDQNQKLTSVVVMYKVKGYNPEAGDWFWANYKPDGTVGAAGKLAPCISCHSPKAANDYVFSHSFK